MTKTTVAKFIVPMECLPVAKLPEGPGWTWEIKLDGWRMEVVKSTGDVTLYSRRAKKFNSQFGSIAQALKYLPDETVIDGEIVAVDEEGRPNFNLLQNFGSAKANVIYFAFDIMMLEGKDLTQYPLSKRRKMLTSVVQRNGRIEISESSDRPLPEMMTFVKSHAQPGFGNMQVPGRSLEIAMAEQQLNAAQVSAGVKQMCCE